MKGLVYLPEPRQIEMAYLELQNTQVSLDPKLIFGYSQWSRFDPRLAEQLVCHLVTYWKDILPMSLNKAIIHSVWPQALGVLLEHALLSPELKKSEKKPFKVFVALVMSGVRPTSGEQYFIGLRAFAGKEMLKDVVLATSPYKVWGYFGRDALVNKAQNKIQNPKTLLSPKQRRGVLSELIKTRKSITVKQYMIATQGNVSRRQAELDLACCIKLKAFGKTRSRIYQKK